MDVATITKSTGKSLDEWEAVIHEAGIADASEATLQALADGNRAYEARYGFLFIVCASGKSAQEMLALLQARMHHETAAELRIAAGEQMKITRLRLAALGDPT